MTHSVNWVLIGTLAILAIALVSERFAAYQCQRTCRARNADPVAWWESEHGPVDWESPDQVNPRLLECICR